MQALAETQPLILHSRHLSLGSPVVLDPHELARVAATVALIKPLWLSAALGFSRVPGTDLGFASPIPLNETFLDMVAAHVTALMQACGTRLVIRNIAGYLRFASSMPEPEFLNRLCARTGCGLGLDLTSLYVDSLNHGFDPQQWLAVLDPAPIVQIMVGGCRRIDGWQVTHDQSPIAEVLALAEHVGASAPSAIAVLERHANFPPVAQLAVDLDRLRGLTDTHAD